MRGGVGVEVCVMSEWIKCSERLPELEKVVLGAFPEGFRFTCYLIKGGHWRLTGSCGQASGYDITHWQPLPEPPKCESSFERWWAHKIATTPEMAITPKVHGWFREAWEAAVAATKSPDFIQ